MIIYDTTTALHPSREAFPFAFPAIGDYIHRIMMKPRFCIFRGSRPTGPRPGAAAALGAAFAAALLFGMLPLWTAATAGAVVLLIFSMRSAIAFCIGGLLVALGTVGGAVSGTNDLARRIPEELRRVDLRFRLIDPRLTGVAEVPQPALVLAEATAFALPGEGRWENVAGRCMIRFPEGRRTPPYGSVIEAQGILRRHPPREAMLRRSDGTVRRIPFAEGFQRHLAARGSEFTFTLRDFRMLREAPSGPAEFFFRLRDAIMRRMLRGIDSDRNRAMVAAFFFGATGGLNAKFRRNFIASGTVHLFAVSGLHIGMLAALFLMLLRPLPFRLRHRLLLVAVWSYVLLTGANAPALRAGFMVSLWCVCRASLKYIPAIDLLGGAAALLLALQPALIGDTGFRYSFVITAALLLLADRQREFHRLGNAEAQLIPSPVDRRRLLARRRWSRYAASSLIGCTAAFLAGAGISLAGSGELLPGSIAANLVMLPLLPFFFVAAALQLISGGCCAALLTGCFDLIACAAGIFSRLFTSLPAAEPGWAAVLLYYAGLFLWFGHPSPHIRRCGAAAALMLLGFQITAPHFAAPKLMILSRSNAHPAAIAAVDPAHARALVVNPPAGDGTLFLAERLRADGIRQTETLYFDRPRRDRAAGAALLERTLPVLRRRLPALRDRRRAGRFFMELEERAGREDAVSVGPGGETIEIVESVPGKLRLAVADRLSGIFAEIETVDTDSGRLVVLRDGKSVKTLVLPWSREIQVWEIPLARKITPR